MRALPIALLSFVLLLFARTAEAHGGSFGERLGGVPPGLREPLDPEPPPPPCECALIECAQCSHGTFTPDRPELRVTVDTETLERNDDFARIRVTYSLRATCDGKVEAYAVLARGPLLAVTAGRIEQGDTVLVGSLAPSQEGRSRYFDAKRRWIDPLLVFQLEPGRCGVRAFPVRREVETRVIVEGIVFSSARPAPVPRLYRDGSRFLVVEGEGDARKLAFLSEEEARRRHGDRADGATLLPMLAAVETAATGQGDAAVTVDRVLVAIEGSEPAAPSSQPPPTP